MVMYSLLTLPTLIALISVNPPLLPTCPVLGFRILALCPIVTICVSPGLELPTGAWQGHQWIHNGRQRFPSSAPTSNKELGGEDGPPTFNPSSTSLCLTTTAFSPPLPFSSFFLFLLPPPLLSSLTGSHSVALADPEFNYVQKSPASTSEVLGLKACATTALFLTDPPLCRPCTGGSGVCLTSRLHQLCLSQKMASQSHGP